MYNASTRRMVALKIIAPFLFSLETLSFSTLRKPNVTGKMNVKIDAKVMSKHFKKKLILEN